ncbi:hypothetical protein DACRYDRAFT_22602 [Dacryopinax primogenitus]|uniref:Secreted protein n=1 Tax=Dacryopinax primogenitus (strain DJM 731) TaxID=1858805 RepID=M5G003_DACPD|nr:uncharacterized protein DACRYDRAFT_22602 [Dacryopinax primogenitus]EJU01480.1 hypothetical protein DACRYDRAFT_22602 [Dacryopinax primogenitus]
MTSFRHVLFVLFFMLLGFTHCLPVLSNSPTMFARAAGPSGSCVSPSGGSSILNLGGTGSIHVEYQGVQGTTPDGTPYHTMGIDVILHDPTSAMADVTLAQGLKPNPPSGTSISGYFTPPLGASGSFNLIIIEHQFIYNEVLSFQAAAPQITIQAGPIQ